MKKIYLIAILAISLITACQPSEAAIEKAIAETESAKPTIVPTNIPSATSVPLSEIDLESILILSGDLPSGFSGAQIRSEPPEMFKNINNYEKAIYQQFQYQDKTKGGVSIFLFETLDDRDAAYNQIVSGFGDSISNEAITTKIGELKDVGELAKYISIETHLLGITSESLDLTYVRCKAVIHIRMADTLDLTSASSYAKLLDERLIKLVCK